MGCALGARTLDPPPPPSPSTRTSRPHSCDIFSDDPSVLVIDTHEATSVYPSPPFQSGAAGDVGEGAGTGATINIPLPRESWWEGVCVFWVGWEGTG